MLKQINKFLQNPRREVKKFFCTSFGVYKDGKTAVSNIYILFFGSLYLFFLGMIAYATYIVIILISQLPAFLLSLTKADLIFLIKEFLIATLIWIILIGMERTGIFSLLNNLFIRKGITCEYMSITPEVKDIFAKIDSLPIPQKKEFLRASTAIECKLINDIQALKETQ